MANRYRRLGCILFHFSNITEEMLETDETLVHHHSIIYELEAQALQISYKAAVLGLIKYL